MSSPTAGTAAPTVTPPFLTKLYNLVEDQGTAELVSWLPCDDGSAKSFTVHKPSEFARDVLPKHFKHNNFSSFVRQLNQYGFHKQDPDRWTFAHESFRRGRPEMLSDISRRRPKSQVGAFLGRPGALDVIDGNALATFAAADQKAVVELGNFGLGGVVGELETLKRDKDLLVRELVVTRNAETKLKSKCDSLERRVDTLERNSKQMQAFILHYFSQVLQPYNTGMTSRKRKRLPASAHASHGIADVEKDEPSLAHESSLAVAPVPSGPSMEALLSMLQQMQIPAGSVDHGGPASAQGGSQSAMFSRQGDMRRDSYAPVTVLELAHDDTSNGVNGSPPSADYRHHAAESKSVDTRRKPALAVNTPVPPSTDHDWSGLARKVGTTSAPPGSGASVEYPEYLPILSTRKNAVTPTLPADPTPSPVVSSPAGDVNPAPRGAPGTTTFANGAYEFPLASDLGPSAAELPTEGLVTDSNLAPNDDLLDDLLDMDNTVELFPPLTDLPQGTDIGALARQIEGLTSAEDGDSTYTHRR
jgi:hypothetical protein